MSRNKMIMTFLLTGCMLLGGCEQKQESQSVEGQELILPEQANYRTVEAKAGDYIKTSKSAASLSYPTRARLFPEADDIRLQDILVSKGDEVKKGDVLVTFNIEEDTVALEELQIALTRAQERLAGGQTDYQKAITEAREEAEECGGHERRMANLEIKKLEVSREQFVYQTNQEILQIQKQIDELEEKKENSVVTAPFDGVVDDVRDFEAGDLVDQNDMLISMHSPNVYLIEVTDAIGGLRYNMEVEIEADFSGEEKIYKGVVVSAPNILPGAMAQESIYIQLEEEIEFNKKWGSMYCSAKTEELNDVLLIDKDAIYKEESKSYVYVLEGDTVKKRFVTVGLSNMESTWILDGLEEGQLVILD